LASFYGLDLILITGTERFEDVISYFYHEEKENYLENCKGILLACHFLSWEEELIVILYNVFGLKIAFLGYETTGTTSTNYPTWTYYSGH